MINYILLGFLNYQPLTGYELKRAIDESTSHFWHAYHSQIYTSLRKMETDGLVTSTMIEGEGQPDRRVYTITPAGQETLQAWLNQPMTEMASVKDELLVRVFFSARRDTEKVVNELVLQRELHLQKLAVYGEICQHMDQHNQELDPALLRDNAFWQATLRMGMRYEQIYIEWLNETIETVRRL